MPDRLALALFVALIAFGCGVLLLAEPVPEDYSDGGIEERK